MDKIRKNKIFKKLLLNSTNHIFCLVIVVFIAFCLALYFILDLFAGIKQESEMQNSTTAVNQLGFSVDFITQQIDTLIDEYIWGNNIDDVLKSKTNEKQNVNVLDSYFGKQNFLSGAVVANLDKSIIFTNNRFLSAENLLGTLELDTKSLLLLFEENKHSYEFVKVKFNSSSANYASMEQFCFVKPIVSSEDGTKVGIIAVFFSRKEFRNTAGISLIGANSEFRIITYKNDIVFSTGNMFMPCDMTYNGLFKGYNPKYNKAVSGDGISSYVSFSNPDSYKCVLTNLDRAHYWNAYKKKITLICLCTGMLLILICYIIVLLISKSQTINTSINILQEKDNNKVAKGLFADKNSLVNIISREVFEHKSLMKQADKNMSSLKRSILLELLTSKSDIDYNTALLDLKKTGVDFNGDYFAVVVLRFNNFEEHIQQNNLNEKKEKEMLTFVVDNIISEYHNCATLIYKNDIVCILNFNTVQTNKCEDALRKNALTVCNTCLNEFDIKFNVGISSTFEGVQMIWHSYYESYLAVEQAQIQQISVCTYRESLKYKKTYRNYTQLIEFEYSLINACKNYEWEDISQLVNQILNKIATDNANSLYVIQIQFSEILKAMFEQISQDQYFDDEIIIKLHHKINEVLHQQNVQEMKNAAEDFIQCLKTYYENNTGDKSDIFINQVNRIIDSEYMNLDLSVAYIADKVLLHPRTLSAKYMQKTKKGLLDAIHTKRIEHAKDLLVKTEKSVVEISNLSGYENVNTFIRVFKKYAGITPGRFRELHVK